MDNHYAEDVFFTRVTKLHDAIAGEGLGYHLMTYGCQMNEHDSEKISSVLEQCGYRPTSLEEANLVILNTCSVRKGAEDRVYGKLGELKGMKRSHEDFKIAVCGCMMQREESRNHVLEHFPHVDIIFGTNNIALLPELILENLQTNALAMDIQEKATREDGMIHGKRHDSFRGYVNIMYGCNNFCTYCIVPYTRGREVSRPLEDVVLEVKRLVTEGAREVTLLGQNVNSYGKTLPDQPTFTKLLESLHEIEGLERIRFMTSHPKDISDELIEAFSRLPKLGKFLHLPVQAGSNRILRAMNRHYTREDYLQKVQKLRSLVPDLALSTDLIVGFPGETEEDFQETLHLVEEVEYDNTFTFIYSPREGTKAASAEGQIPEEIKHERFNRLTDVLYPIQRRRKEEKIGKVEKVLLERVSKNDPNMLSGRSEDFTLIHVPGDVSEIGTIVPVRILDANTFACRGERMEETR